MDRLGISVELRQFYCDSDKLGVDERRVMRDGSSVVCQKSPNLWQFTVGANHLHDVCQRIFSELDAKRSYPLESIQGLTALAWCPVQTGLFHGKLEQLHPLRRAAVSFLERAVSALFYVRLGDIRPHVPVEAPCPFIQRLPEADIARFDSRDGYDRKVTGSLFSLRPYRVSPQQLSAYSHETLTQFVKFVERKAANLVVPISCYHELRELLTQAGAPDWVLALRRPCLQEQRYQALLPLLGPGADRELPEVRHAASLLAPHLFELASTEGRLSELSAEGLSAVLLCDAVPGPERAIWQLLEQYRECRPEEYAKIQLTSVLRLYGFSPADFCRLFKTANSEPLLDTKICTAVLNKSYVDKRPLRPEANSKAVSLQGLQLHFVDSVQALATTEAVAGVACALLKDSQGASVALEPRHLAQLLVLRNALSWERQHALLAKQLQELFERCLQACVDQAESNHFHRQPLQLQVCVDPTLRHWYEHGRLAGQPLHPASSVRMHPELWPASLTRQELVLATAEEATLEELCRYIHGQPITAPSVEFCNLLLTLGGKGQAQCFIDNQPSTLSVAQLGVFITELDCSLRMPQAYLCLARRLWDSLDHKRIPDSRLLQFIEDGVFGEKPTTLWKRLVALGRADSFLRKAFARIPWEDDAIAFHCLFGTQGADYAQLIDAELRLRWLSYFQNSPLQPCPAVPRRPKPQLEINRSPATQEWLAQIRYPERWHAVRPDLIKF